MGTVLWMLWLLFIVGSSFGLGYFMGKRAER